MSVRARPPGGAAAPRDRRASTGALAMDDATLLAEVRAGNPAVADAFCLRVLPTVDRTVRRLLGRDDNDEGARR